MRRFAKNWLILILSSATFFAAGCTSYEKIDRLWWQKKPNEAERAFFDWALNGPQAPSDGYIKPKDYVGWYGILRECRDVKVRVPTAAKADKPITQSLLRLDHRYADQMNVYRGIGDHVAVQTVSLFGDGEFLAVAKTCADLWPGDLVRAYGDVRRSDDNGRWVVETVHVRSWPRDQYELAPLRPQYANGKLIRQAPNSWPQLKLDREVPSSQTPIDALVKRALIPKLEKVETRERAALALAEFGGPDAVAALTKFNLAGPLRRAKREIGPTWRPRAEDPYWAESSDPELYKMRGFTP